MTGKYFNDGHNGVDSFRPDFGNKFPSPVDFDLRHYSRERLFINFHCEKTLPRIPRHQPFEKFGNNYVRAFFQDNRIALLNP